MSFCFPKANEATRSAHRLPWKSGMDWTVVPKSLLAAASGGNETMRDFVVANHDFLGVSATLLVNHMKMNAQYRGAKGEAAELLEAAKMLIWSDSSINAGFRQLMVESEVRMAGVVNDLTALGRLCKVSFLKFSTRGY